MTNRTLHLFAVAVGLLTALPGTAVRADDAPPAPAPKDPNLIPGWGRWVDADHDCKYRLDATKLLVSVPGSAHDLSVEQGKMNAPMILQDAQGDFDFQVLVSGKFAPGEAAVQGRTPYQGAGLVLAQDNKNYVRLERAVYTRADRKNFHYVNFEVRLNGQVVRLGEGADYPFEDKMPAYLRLERRGAQVRGSVSEDGENWHNLGVKNFVATVKLMAGVAAINASNAPFAPQFEEFKLAKAAQEPAAR